MNAGIGPGASSLVERAKAIILKPKDEWPKIETEQTTQGDILRSWVLPLAAIGPVASFIGGQVFGYGALFVSYKPSLMSGLTTAILSFVLAIVAVFVLAIIADFLAPKFEGTSNKLAAFKLVAFSATASWLAGIFGLIPALAVFGLLGLYSAYLFYTGAGTLMKIPEDKKVVYTDCPLISAAVLYWIVGIIVAAIVGLSALGGGMASLGDAASSGDEVTLNIPGVGKIDTGEIEKAAEQAERIQSGELKAVPAETLKAMLPESIGDFQRTAVSTSALGQAGGGAEGTYTAGDYRFQLRVNDMLALSGLAGMGAAMGIEHSEESADGYERVGTEGGQWRNEKWNNKSNDGSYGIMVGNRFQVEASGNVPSIDVLKAAVAKIDRGDLEDFVE